MQNKTDVISLYAIVRADNRYFGGFDPTLGKAIVVDDISRAKFFTNKFDANLRPDEQMVEVLVKLTSENMTVTTPFKPRRRSDRFPEQKDALSNGRRATDASIE